MLPIRYSLRNVGVRRGSSVLTMLGVAITVAVFAGVLSLRDGFRSVYEARGADDVSAIVSSDLGANERQLYQIEWQAARRLKLIAERDTTGGIGGDIQYTTRIDWRGRRRVDRSPQ